MPWNNAAMLTDKDGNFIPQLWDPSQNKFIPWDGKVQQSGTIVDFTLLSGVTVTAGSSVEIPVSEIPNAYLINSARMLKVFIRTSTETDYSVSYRTRLTAFGSTTSAGVTLVSGAASTNTSGISANAEALPLLLSGNSAAFRVTNTGVADVSFWVCIVPLF